MKSWFSVAALLVSALAVVLALRRSPDAANGTTRAAEVNDRSWVERLDRVEARMAELERRMSAPQLAQPPVVTREVSAGASGEKLDELVKRVEALERPQPEKDSVNLGRVRVMDETEKLAASKAVAKNYAATEEQRVEALARLRGMRNPDGSDARLDVLDDVIALAETSTQGAVRADVWRQLSHVTDPRLRDPLLRALAGDAHAKAREEAAETLADFLPDAWVEQALRRAAEGDADAGVRRQAQASLNGR